MPYWNVSAINGTSFETVYVSTAITVPWLIPLLLFFEFMVIMVSGVVVQNKKIGYSNVPMWGSIAGLITSTTSIMWSVVTYATTETFTLTTLSVNLTVLAITIIFVAWFFLSDMD